MGNRRDMKPPVIGGTLRGIANLHTLRGGTFTESRDFILVGLRREFEGLYDFKTGQSWCYFKRLAHLLLAALSQWCFEC